ncbi:MAG: SDR family NAD(P)-dependent oxidoreductase [Akkermansiaceae bacterium]
MQPIAVIGLGALFPKASDYSEYWNNIVNKRDCLDTIPESRWNLNDYYDKDPSAPDKIYCQRGGVIPDIWFDPVSFGLPPNTLESIDAAQLLTLQVAKDTLEDAGYPLGSKHYDHERTAVILGVSGTTMQLGHSLIKRQDYPLFEKVLRNAGLSQAEAETLSSAYRTAYPNWNSDTFAGHLANVVAGRISNRLDLGGLNFTVDAACASSLCAINMAVCLLNSGQCDMVVTGGVDTDNSSTAFMSFAKTGIFSTGGKIRSFDKDADGTLISEGIGLFALKRLPDAIRDNDRIYAQISGFGAASDGRQKSIFAPAECGQIRAMKTAYETANIDPTTVGLVEAHSPGTRVGDAAEFGALRSVFQSEKTAETDKSIALGSVKTQIGHTKAAAGAAGLMKAVLALHHKVLPPTIHVEQPNPELKLEASPFYLNTEARPWIVPDGTPRRAAVNSLGFGGSNYHTILEEAPTQVLRPEGLQFPLGQTPFDSQKNSAGVNSPAVMFSGQGSQFLEMGVDFALYSSDFRKALETLDQMFRQDGKVEISKILFPPKAFEISQIKEQKSALKNTHYTHAALAALQMSQFLYLRHAGLSPKCVFGHSFGEVTALWAAGVFDNDSYLRLIYQRGKALAQESGEAVGTLISVRLSSKELQPHLSSFSGVQIANINSPSETVVGGSYADINAFIDSLESQSIGYIRLDVSAAFHTSCVYYAKSAWEKALESATFATPHTPVYSNNTGNLYPENPDAIRDILKRHPFEPVRFTDQVRKIHTDGHQNFLEIGPRNILSRLVSRTIQDPSITTIACYPSNGMACLQQLEDAARSLKLTLPELSTNSDFNAGISDNLTKGARASTAIRLSAMGYRSPETLSKFTKAMSDLRANPIFTSTPEASLPSPTPVLVAPEKLSDNIQIVVASLETHKEFLSLQRTFMETLQREPSDSVKVRLLRETMDDITRVHQEYINGQLANLQSSQSPAPRVEQAFSRLSSPVSADNAHADPQPSQLNHQLHASIVSPSIPLIDQKSLSETFLSIISEKTGYPAEVIQPHMDLEADLGIDSIKRVEILAAMKETFDPNMSNEGFEELLTIEQILTHLETRQPQANSYGKATSSEQSLSKAPLNRNELQQQLISIISEKTGYPAEVIQPQMDLEADLGIDSIKRVEILAAMKETFDPNMSNEGFEELLTIEQILTHLETRQPQANSYGKATSSEQSLSKAPLNRNELQQQLISIISEKTGYPAEVIQPQMDLEADLGIDSIKRVEIFAAMKEAFDPDMSNEGFEDLLTIEQILTHIETRQPQADSSQAQTSSETHADSDRFDRDGLQQLLISVISEKTGYPEEVIKPEMDLEADLGIDSIKRVEILAKIKQTLQIELQPDDLADCRGIGEVADFLFHLHVTEEANSQASLSCEALSTPLDSLPLAVTDRVALESALPANPQKLGNTLIISDGGSMTHSVISELGNEDQALRVLLTPGADSSDFANAPVMTDWSQKSCQEALAQCNLENFDISSVLLIRDDLKNTDSSEDLAGLVILTGLIKGLLKISDNDDRPHYLIAAASISGKESTTSCPHIHSLIGALTRTLSFEWESTRVASVIYQESTTGAQLLNALCAPDAPLETFLSEESRETTGWKDYVIPPENTAYSPDDVFLVSGGARGITAECVKNFCQKIGGGRFILIGRSSQTELPDWLAKTATKDLKKHIVQSFKDKGTLPSPREIEAEYKHLASLKEIHETLDAISKLGGKAVYCCSDIADPASLKSAIHPILEQWGEVTGIIHGAGILADNLIEKLTRDDFFRVYHTKVTGLKNLLEFAPKDLKLCLLFSSVAASIGNAGQSLYAIANQLLNDQTPNLQTRFPEAIICAMNWGPWDAGMVTVELKKRFSEMGIRTIPIPDGAQLFTKVAHSNDPTLSNLIIGDRVSAKELSEKRKRS